MSQAEILRESIRRLERALEVEQARRDEAESTLTGIRCITEAIDLAATDEALLTGLQPMLRYRAGAILLRSPSEPETFVATIAGHPALAALRWRVGPLGDRVLAGQTVALYDVRRTPELATLADVPDIRSALCVPLATRDRPAILIGVHEQPAFFAPHQVALARAFTKTAIPVLESVAAREHAHHRRVAEDEAAHLARTNELLREQLATIQAQQLEIHRLSAPMLRVARQTLVVPLIGEFDHDALIRVTETLLYGISEHRARSVILDFTGFESIDPGIRERIQSLTRAAALLGARCWITGLRPAIAIALADAGFGAHAYATLADALDAIRA